MSLRSGQRSRSLSSYAHLSKDSVLLVQKVAGVQREEKLRVVRVGFVLIGHGQKSAMVEPQPRVKLIRKGTAIDALSSIASARGVPSLDHKTRHQAVENRPVIVLSQAST